MSAGGQGFAERRAGLVVLVVLAAAAGILGWHSPILYPLKLLTVTLHETGHVLAAYLVGGSADSVSIDRYQGGLAWVRVPPQTWRQVVVSSAGYVGSAAFGTALLLLSAGRSPRRPRLTLWLLGGGLLALALLFFRDLFSWAFALPTAAALLLAARFAPDGVTRPLAIFVSVFALLYALFDLRDDVLRLPWESRGGPTDADALARLLPLPALFWGVVWTALSLGLLWFGLRRVLRRAA